MQTALETDILVQNQLGPVAAIEVKNRQHLTADAATSFRRNLLEDGSLYPTRFFLLVSQDWGHLWVGTGVNDTDAPPTRTFPMSQVVQKLVPDLRPGERLIGNSLKLPIYQWLCELADGASNFDSDAENALVSVGFLNAIRGCTLTNRLKNLQCRFISRFSDGVSYINSQVSTPT